MGAKFTARTLQLAALQSAQLGAIRRALVWHPAHRSMPSSAPALAKASWQFWKLIKSESFRLFLNDEKKVSVSDIGLTHKDIHEARLIHDAEVAELAVAVS
jgi:hypothetical protein